jgi:sporulation protein YlmC with PRC-barrel domain
MSELRVGATVRGTDGDLGKVDALVIDPIEASVTHLVVGHDSYGRRALVALALVGETTPDVVNVDLTAASLLDCPPFDEPAYNIPDDGPMLPDMGYAADPGTYFLEPFASPLDGLAMAGHERIPKGEITIRRHDEVLTSDGTSVGRADELLIDPGDGHVTHIVVRENHALRHDDDVVVPIGGASFSEGRVVLGIDLAAVHALDRIPVKRHGHVRDESS